MNSCFVFDDPEFSECHASTVVATTDGLFMACFAGPREGHRRTSIWSAKYKKGKWHQQKMLVDSKQIDGRRIPLWNPVLYEPPNGELVLFYRYGKSPEEWKCRFIVSKDNGGTWSNPRQSPGLTGPVRNRPCVLSNESVVIPTSTEWGGWRIHFELFDKNLKYQYRAEVHHAGYSAIQPAILDHEHGILQALCRTENGKIGQTWSEDYGNTWSDLTLTDFDNPNAAIDAIKVPGKGFLLAFNDSVNDRSNLSLASSSDGRTWEKVKVVEKDKGEHSYPSLALSKEGDLHLLYTYNRRNIKHVFLNEEEVTELFEPSP